MGPIGPTGLTGVVSTSTIAGIIAGIPFGGAGASWVFAGPTVTVTTTANQRITGSAVGIFGHTNNNPQPVSFSLCTSDVAAGSALTPFYGISYLQGTVGATPNRTALSAAASVVPAMAGTYKVGFCVKNNSTTVNFGANDFVNGWFIITN
jgi:spore maturation protein SpmB